MTSRMARRPPTPRCRFCRRTDDPAAMVTEYHRAGIARGSTRYTMRPYYHHAACLAAFEENERRLNEKHRAELEAELEAIRKAIEEKGTA